MTHKFARTLTAGDLIAVPYSNHLTPAIFKGYGKSSGNIHFFELRMEKGSQDFVKKRIDEGKRPYIQFINRREDDVIAKIDPDELEANLRLWYDEYRFLLTKKGMI